MESTRVRGSCAATREDGFSRGRQGHQQRGNKRKSGAEGGKKMDNRMHRFVQLDKLYTQVVAGNYPEIQQPGLNQAVNEEVGSCAKQEVMEKDQHGVEIIEFSPKKEECQWLEGSKVAMVRSLALVTDIQERMDVDGRLIILSPLGGRRVLLMERFVGYLDEYMKQNKELFDTWFEFILPWEVAPQLNGRLAWIRISRVLLNAWCDGCFEKIAASIRDVLVIHEDTKKKTILCDGRGMILCSQACKISKNVLLKVEEKLYEITVTEEEWRLDPDWWLSMEDRHSPSNTESEYSSS
ncbi:hypothetical protein SLEP1_g54168 [Rubroshorea leprosula]|uniref:DUF4283 domain-containing protein n=1 Tax=Rubroshorea leprosula TaxID=152421 RepID=A0AAV5MCP7_9ROSI|nr:hypothetical protein SLEP1_g54168 [Rubroshorea leprosula]